MSNKSKKDIAIELCSAFSKAFNASPTNAIEYTIDVMSMSPYCPDSEDGAKDTGHMFMVLFNTLLSPMIEKGIKSEGLFEEALDGITDAIGCKTVRRAVDHIFKSLLWYGSATGYSETYLSEIVTKTSFISHLATIIEDYIDQAVKQ